MAPRRKDQENSDLPLNLTVNRKVNRKLLFLYRRPTDGRKYSLGSDRARAIQTAKELNAHYERTSGLLDKVIEGGPIPERSFSACVAEFSAHGLRKLKKLAPATLREYQRMLSHIAKHFEGQEADAITTRDIAQFLRKYPPRASRLYRCVLSMAFHYAKSQGVRTLENPVADTIPKHVEVQRERLTLEQYRLVHEQASRPIQNAMDLALHTLQRREDIAALRFADNREGYLWVRPLKIRKHGVALKMGLTPTLEEIIARCRDGILSPWMIHQPYGAKGAPRQAAQPRLAFTRLPGRPRTRTRASPRALPGRSGQAPELPRDPCARSTALQRGECRSPGAARASQRQDYPRLSGPPPDPLVGGQYRARPQWKKITIAPVARLMHRQVFESCFI